ncbi:30S ribosomal protein S3 [Candidatus Woesearchaeota archaeon]|jgi:small subunit ribosomal protein S3|nr:30S ribosomal protein S3 [Candidatus Woesearchaeota archaeon]
MIERQIVASNVKELEIQEYIINALKNLGQSHIKLQRTPLGEKIIIHASRPGLIVGRKGQNIKKLTEDLKANFKLENPQIEINEVENPNLDAQIVAERIASSLEKFGTQRFKGIGHRVMSDVMGSGALGIEILISGKIPSARSRRWRFYNGYLKKCGDIAIVGVRKAYVAAQIKTGTVGIQVRIMPPDVKLPDYVKIEEETSEIVEEMKEDIEKKDKPKKAEKAAKEEKKEKKKAEMPKKKRAVKKEEKTEATAEKEESKSEEPAGPAAKAPAKTPAEGAPVDTEDFGEETPAEQVKEETKEEVKEEAPAKPAEKTESK